MNLWDIIIICLILGAVFLAVRRIRKDRKNGKTCGGNCAGCQMCGSENCRKQSR